METIGEVVVLHASEVPSAVAMVDGADRYTWAELLAKVQCTAGGLQSRGVGKGDRVAMLSDNSADCLVLFLACTWVGAIFVPYNTRLAGAEYEAITVACSPSVLVCTPAFGQFVDDLGATVPHTASSVDDLTDGSHGDGPATLTPAADSSSAVCMTYTSGSTGRPKGVMLGHAAFTDLLPMAARTWGMSRESVVLAALPMFHIGGLSWCMSSLMLGAEMVILPRPDPQLMLDAIQDHGVTHICMVPAILQGLLAAHAGRPQQTESLELVTCGGSPIPSRHLVESSEAFGCRFIAFYGLSEAGGGVSQHVVTPEMIGTSQEHLLGSAGRAMDGVEIDIRDPATGRPVPTGEIGEVVVRASSVMLGLC